MPRANRYLLPDHVCHVTHRCHDRSFLLRFARDREGYRARLREACMAARVRILTYCITSNHVHLVTSTNDRAAIAALMQRLEGDHARAYNCRRKNRSQGHGAYENKKSLTGDFRGRKQPVRALKPMQKPLICHARMHLAWSDQDGKPRW